MYTFAVDKIADIYVPHNKSCVYSVYVSCCVAIKYKAVIFKQSTLKLYDSAAHCEKHAHITKQYKINNPVP